MQLFNTKYGLLLFFNKFIASLNKINEIDIYFQYIDADLY